MPKKATIGVMRWQMRDRDMRDQAYLVDQFSLAASLAASLASESLDSLEPRRLECFKQRKAMRFLIHVRCWKRSNAVRGGDVSRIARVSVGSRFSPQLLEIARVATS